MIKWDRQQPDERALLPLEVATLAIDLTNGWVMIETAINMAASSKINFQILMLTTDATKLPKGAPDEVRAWSGAGLVNRRLIADQLGKYKGPKDISVEVREYNEIPTIHGIRSSKGNDILYVITECKAKSGFLPVYDFGEGNYKLFTEHGSAESLLILRSRYNDRFNDLWSAGVQTLCGCYPTADSR